MIHRQLFDKQNPHATVRTGVIGTGHFATATVTQAQAMARLHVPAVADLNVEAARRAYERAGIAADDIVVCENRPAALHALERGEYIIVTDAELLMDLPLDVIVEATGNPEAGARHALWAIEHGKHVAMVGKETDVVVGPILAQRARAEGLVYTTVDGDQHGLLIALVLWAQELGLEVLCAGKARESDYIFNPQSVTAAYGKQKIALSNDETRFLEPSSGTATVDVLAQRQATLAALPQVANFDLTEMAIAANATGLPPDRPLLDMRSGQPAGELHCPPIYTREIPEVLCPQKEGGILANRGVIDMVTCLRLPHEATLGGGVFAVVACDNAYSRHILATKGLMTNTRTSAALIYRPYHLCGVETPMSILCAALLGVPTGAATPRPLVDTVMRTRHALKAGDLLGDDHHPGVQALMATAQRATDDAPLPYHMGNGHRLRVDVPADTIITVGMVDAPKDSELWQLRREQDAHFGI